MAVAMEVALMADSMEELTVEVGVEAQAVLTAASPVEAASAVVLLAQEMVAEAAVAALLAGGAEAKKAARWVVAMVPVFLGWEAGAAEALGLEVEGWVAACQVAASGWDSMAMVVVEGMALETEEKVGVAA